MHKVFITSSRKSCPPLLYPHLRGFVLIFLFFLGFCTPGKSQEKCATVEYDKLQKLQNPLLHESDAVFEHWIQNQKELRSLVHRTFGTQQNEIKLIPVVVHIVHNGEPVGEGSNLSKERILSQIAVLNEDFRRLNADTVNTPNIFVPVAADSEIEFVLAQTDPEGLATEGIVRVEGTQESWNINEDVQLKKLSYWPAEDYLNIWVTNLENKLLGYAEFPVSDLPGLEDAPDNRLLDGVVVEADYFGMNDNVKPISKGRTATHEVGHFLGLRHIWGDGKNCDTDDFCEDTPLADTEHYTCNDIQFSCGFRNMIENYMDYTNDVCMNIFTLDQKARMQIVLANSPRRTSLVNANGAFPPIIVSNNVSLRKLINPEVSYCENTLEPVIQIRNHGANNVNSIELSLEINGELQETITKSLSLEPLDTTNISFSTLELPYGPHQLEIEILSVNGDVNEAPNGSSYNSTFHIRPPGPFPFSLTFDSIPPTWLVLNPNNQLTWEIADAPGNGINNSAAFMGFYEYENGLGAVDYLITHSLDLTGLNDASLSFKLAYAPYNREHADGLVIAVSTDCGNTFPEENVIYRKYGAELATAPDTEEPFVPASRSDWRIDTLDLSRFIGLPNVQIGFLAQGDYGNNLYLDDVSVQIERAYNLDLAANKVLAPFPATCEENPKPVLQVKNNGQEIISTFDVAYNINNGVADTASFSGFNLEKNETGLIELPALALAEGYYNLQMDVINPNGKTDENPVNNTILYAFAVDGQEDLIPLRENFNIANFENTSWIAINLNGEIGWQVEPLNQMGAGNNAAYIENYNYAAVGAKDYFVSPVLDFSGSTEASLFFSVAYGLNENYTDRLSVLVSRDCGKTFSDTIYAKSGEALSTVVSSDEFVPTSEADFRQEFIDLSEYAGETGIRIAFENINGFGNNVYIDDIEFFVSNNPEPTTIGSNLFQIYPNPAEDHAYITFDLASREDVYITMFDPMGRQVTHELFPNTLNQTYTFQLAGLATGIYFVKITGSSIHEIRRVMVAR